MNISGSFILLLFEGQFLGRRPMTNNSDSWSSNQFFDATAGTCKITLNIYWTISLAKEMFPSIEANGKSNLLLLSKHHESRNHIEINLRDEDQEIFTIQINWNLMIWGLNAIQWTIYRAPCDRKRQINTKLLVSIGKKPAKQHERNRFGKTQSNPSKNPLSNYILLKSLCNA